MANLQLAKNLFYLRTISGLKQDDIADIFNISRQACSNYETSTRTPDLGYLASFAAHFHVTMDQLILCDLEAEHFIPDSTVVNLSILEKFQNSFSPDFIGI